MELVKQMDQILKDADKPKDQDQSYLAMEPCLTAKVHRADGKVEDRGVLGRKSVTTAFVNYLVAAMQNSTTSFIDTFKYHAPGSGSAAENVADTTMTTEVGIRGTGNLGTKTGSANVFQSVSTVTFTAAATIQEHGLFNSATGGTLLDRTSFTGISVASNDSIAFTYQLTCAAGG